MSVDQEAKYHELPPSVKQNTNDVPLEYIKTKKCVIASRTPNISKGYQQKKALEKKWMSKHDFMRWYDVIQEFTFPSVDIPIDLDEAKALVRLYHHRVNRNKPLTTQQHDTLTKFKDKIQNYLEHKISFNIHNGFFVRLSSRSPKDATMFEPYLNQTKQTMYKILQQKIKDGEENDYNTQTVAFFQACVNEMRVYSMDDIINLLCNSERVLVDLNTWIIGYNDDNVFDMKLVVREWNDIIIGSEYRAFVSANGNLNALCQYYNFLYFPFVAANKQLISEKIRDFYNDKLRQRLMDHSELLPCVIDFVLLGQYSDLEESKVFVVELNMFHDYDQKVKISSGSEMFDWTKDKNVLLNGPFEFRINERVCEYTFYRKFVNPDWLEIMQCVLEKMDKDRKIRKYVICCVIAVIVLIVAVVCAFMV
eukprot:240474_1